MKETKYSVIRKLHFMACTNNAQITKEVLFCLKKFNYIEWRYKNEVYFLWL